MGTLRGQLIDRNRLSKRYPLVRAPVRLTYIGDSDLAIEVGSIYFDNAESGVLTFDAKFIDTSYQIVATTREYGSAEAPNVNIYVTNKTQSSVQLNASAPFTGYVDVFAVRVG